MLKRPGELVRALLVAAFVMAVAPSQVVAQDDGEAPLSVGGMEISADDLYPKIQRRQVDRYERMLRLDDDQKEMVGVLFDGYLLAMREKQTGYKEMFQQYMEKMQGAERDWSAPGAMEAFQGEQREFMEASQKFQLDMVAIDEGFMGDVKSVLREEQQESFARVERARLREMVMRQSQFGGLGVDLYDVLETIHEREPLPANVEEAVVRYEEDLERPLREMWKWGLEMQEEQAEMMDDLMGGDMSSFQEIMDKMSEMMKTIRNITRDHRRRISNLLEDEPRAKFEREYDVRNHPDVFNESSVTKAIKSAEGMGLTDDQLTRVGELRSSYEQRGETVNRAWADTIEEQMDELGFQYFMTMGMGNEAVDEKVEERKKLDREFRDRLEAILTPEQRAELPPHEEVGANPWAEMMEGQMEGGGDGDEDGDR